MDHNFIREKKELAYHAHIFDVYNDYLRLPDGKHVVYDLVDHVDGCCVLPVDEDGNLILVSQYRNDLYLYCNRSEKGNQTTGSGRIYPNSADSVGRSHDYDTGRRNC